MKKTKLLTSLIALALVASLGACEVNVDVGGVDVGGVDVGDVDIGGDSSDTSSTESEGTTPSESSEDTSSSSSTPEEPPEPTYTYSLEVENGESLTLNYDGALESQTGVVLTIWLVTTPSEGTETKEAATENDVTFTGYDQEVITISGLTVLPLKGGETSITIAWADKATATVGVTVNDITVYGPTSWADYITNAYDLSVIAGAFGDVSLDEILPFSYELLTNSSYSFQNYYVSAESFRLMYSWPSDSNGLTSAWDTLLTDFGYVKVSSETSGVYTTVTYTLEGGYKVEIKYSTVGDWDLYLYPPEPEPEPATTWNEYITNENYRAAVSGLFGSVEALDEFLPFYGDTDPVSITAGTHYSKGARLVIEYSSDILATWVSLLTNDGWEQTAYEAGWETTYTFEKDGYTVDLELMYGTLYVYVYPKAEEPEPATCWNDYITNENYRAAVSELFGSVEALDEFLPFYSDTEPASIVTGTHYSKGARLVITYNSNILSAWVSLFEADGWTQTDHTVSYNETYTFEKDGYTVDLELEWGTTYVYVYPKAEEADEDLETAQEILNAVQGKTPNWTAFYGEAVDEWDVYTTEYLTTDEDGNLYGYKNEYDDWEETTETSYYYGGAKCVYNYSGVAQTPGEVYITYEEELEYFTYPLTISFNLSSDPYTLTALDDGYELTVAKSTTPVNTYTFTVDASYNLLAIDRDTLISPADEIVSSHVEGITYADVEAFIATTNFNPADFGFGKTSAADQINAVVSKLTEVGYEFQYDDGFYYTNMELRPGDDSSAYYYDALTITATPDNRGYMAQTSMDILDLENTYYSYEYFSDGTDTYYYDAENGQSKEEEPYEFEAYLAMAEMYFDWMDFDQVCELIEASASVSDIEVDDDYEVSDDTIYIYANNEDWSLYYELDVEYDEDGLTYFSFSYQEDSYAYAVALTPTQYVDDPEWYVPTTSSRTIADLFNAALEEKNYTIVLEITDYQSNETSYVPNGFSPYVQLEPLQDLWCKITYTTDAAVVEYYGSYDELLAGTVMDVEYYLNTDSGLDIFMILAWYEVDPVYFQWTEDGLTWQDYLGSLFGLEDYFSNFVEGETTTTERGTEVSYTLDNLDSDFLEALINALVDNGNYWAWETHGVEQILSEGTDVSYTVTYLEDSGIIEFVFVSDEYTYYDADHYYYYLEQTTIKVYVLDAGSSSTPEYTLEYNW